MLHKQDRLLFNNSVVNLFYQCLKYNIDPSLNKTFIQNLIICIKYLDR